MRVGVIEKIELPQNGDILKKIYVKSQIDFDKLRKVFLVKSDPQWEAIKEEIIQLKDGE